MKICNQINLIEVRPKTLFYYHSTWLIISHLNRELTTVILTLYGPNSFFRRFSGHNLR